MSIQLRRLFLRGSVLVSAAILANRNKLWAFNAKQYFQNSILMPKIALCDNTPDYSALPYIGMSIRSLNDRPGMEVMLVNSDSPAWHAGVKAGDILIEIDGRKINNINDYRQAMWASVQQENKEVVEMKLMRKDALKTLRVYCK